MQNKSRQDAARERRFMVQSDSRRVWREFQSDFNVTRSLVLALKKVELPHGNSTLNDFGQVTLHESHADGQSHDLGEGRYLGLE